MGEPGHIGDVERPGVEPGRGDGAQEGVGGDRVLVGCREEQQEAGAVGQGADFLPAAAQERRWLRGKRVQTGALTLGQYRGELGGSTGVSVGGAQDPYAYALRKSFGTLLDAFRKWGADTLPRARELRWRSVRERRGVHRSHHT